MSLSSALLCLAFFAAPPPLDPLFVEANRLEAQAASRATSAGSAVDLLRMRELADWLPDGHLDAVFARRVNDAKAAPLVRAVALYLQREQALLHLDPQAAQAAAKRLGLIDAVQLRPGAAPHSTARFTPSGWRTYPKGLGAGTLRLEAILRPNQATRATVATRLVSAEGGPAVLRLGYDDAVVVWLNGDEMYQSPATHPHFLDQAAIPIVLRPGDNRLVVSVRQKSGAWRLTMRVTDAVGEPLAVEAHADVWGDVPEPAEGDPPEDVESLWTTLFAAADAEPPVAQDLRDLADYARTTGLPDPDQSMPRVAVEGTWRDDRSPRSLRAWLRILPEDERTDVRSKHPHVRPIEQADVYASLRLRLGVAWQHYYARRHRETRALVDAIIADSPEFQPAQRLRAVLDEDLGLTHRAVSRLAKLQARWPDRIGALRGLVTSLQSAGRIEEAVTHLEALQKRSERRPDDAFQLATVYATRGRTNRALALLDGVYAARPDLTSYAIEAAEIALADGRTEDALARFETLARAVQGDATVARRLASLYMTAGDRARAIEALRGADANDPDVQAMLARLTQSETAVDLGPTLDELRKTPLVAGVPAHVLYHHARTVVDARGLAVRHVRRVVRVQSEEGGRRFAQWQLPYVPSTQRLELLAARLYRAGAPPASPSRSDRDLSEPEYRLYYDLRAEVLDFPPPRDGDLIEVVWRLTDTDPDPAFPDYYGELAYLQEVAPRAWSVVEIEGPKALRIEVVPRGVSVRRKGSRIVARNVPGLPLETGMPGPSSMRAYVHVSTAQSWTEINDSYRRLLGDRDAPTSAMKALAMRWGGAGDDRAVMGRLYAAVAARTRYVGLEFGVRSFLPAQPAVTLARGYGDCKDKATLLIALARSRGIDAHLVLVRTRPSGAIASQPASFAVFDHAIVYLPGLDRFMDPTVDRNDPWTLPPNDQGAKAFVIDIDKDLREIPMDPAEANQSEWGMTARVRPDGSATGRVTWTTRGQPASLARRTLEAEGARAEYVEQLLTRRFPGAAVTPERYAGLEPAFDPVIVSGAVELPAFRKTEAGFDVPMGGAAWGLVARFAQAASRKSPLSLNYHRRESMRLQLELPAGFTAQVPPPVSLRSPFGVLRAEARATGQRLSLNVTFDLTARRVDPSDYRAFRAWLSQVDQALAHVVEVRR